MRQLLKPIAIAYICVMSIMVPWTMVGCHHRQPAPYIDPSREVLPPIAHLESIAIPPPARPKREVIHDAKIPMSCVADLDQDQSDCRMTGNPTVARCNNMLVRFSCLSYRQQKNTVDKTVKDGGTRK